MRKPDRRPWTVGPFAFVPLTQGYVATIDASDLPLVSGHLWYAQEIGGSVYAARNADRTGGRRGRLVYLHRVVTGDAWPEVDHRDGDGLHNCRSNLRQATRRQNNYNRPRPQNNRSGFKGVCWDKAVRRWKAYLRLNGRQTHLGYFETPEAAAEARRNAAKSLHGEFYRE